MSVSFDRELDQVVRASDRPTYNTAAVERLTGVRPATFRAWERRYGFPKPRRLPANQRLYSDRDVAAIRWLQQRTDAGLAISHAIRLLLERSREASDLHPTDSRPGRPSTAITGDLTQSLLALNYGAAERVLREAFAMNPIEEICRSVISPTVADIRTRRLHGEVSSAAEQYATSFIRRKLFALLNAYDTGRGRGSVFVGCAPDEWHEVDSLVISLLLVRKGIYLSYLGPNLGAAGLGETLAYHRPDLLVISAMSEQSARRVAELAAVISSLPAPRPALAFGGQGFDDERRRRRVAGTYLGLDADAAASMVVRLLDDSTSGSPS